MNEYEIKSIKQSVSDISKVHIDDVIEESIAYKLGIKKGDKLLKINGKEVIDVFDYRYLMYDEKLNVIIEKDGVEKSFDIKKGEFEDIGLIFYEGLIDNAKSCTNKCIFCFIDQLPKGMRETLYFKDDDSRLSFLQGNYVTLTNMKEKDLDRIIFYKLSPINVSVHTTDLELRRFMLKNPNSDKLINYLDKLYDAGIDLNFQIVLVKGVNDGKHLEKTINDLSKYATDSTSLSVVPIGLTKFRDRLYDAKPFEKDDCIQVIELVEKYQKKLFDKIGTRFVFASDEFYLTAQKDMPSYDSYETFPQIENGVGMITSLEYEVEEDFYVYHGEYKSISIVTGVLAYDTIRGICDKIESKSNVKIYVHKVINTFFGEHITVSGLMTGTDIIKTLKNSQLGDKVLIPINALKSGEEILLDDYTVSDLEKELGKAFVIVGETGLDLLDSIYS